MASLSRCICRAARSAAAPTKSLLQAELRVGSRRTVSLMATAGSAATRRQSWRLQAGTSYTGLQSMQKRTFFVQTETTPNEDSIKFIPGTTLSDNGQTYEFMSSQEARKSPLATSLFDIAGVKLVFFGPDFLTVTKAEDVQWALLKPEIYSVIIEHFSAGKALFYEGHNAGDGPEDTRILDTDSEVVAMIKELLDTRVRPAIQEDGGDIEYRGFDENTGIVTVSLKGSCRGCDSSTVTLKNGIERMLTHYIPEVKSVEQVISQEEVVAADEFAKFEQRLRSGGKTVTI